MKKISPFNLDRYGSREERAADMNKADNIFANGVFGGLAVFIFVLIDFVCLRIVWNLVQTEDPFFIDCIAVACAAALDVPLAIAAIVLKKYNQGLYDRQEKNLIMILSIAVFTIAFVFSFCFRIFTKDLSFDIGTGSTLTNTLAETAETDTAGGTSVLVVALYSGVIPLLTSIASFIISFFGYDPLKIKIGKLEKGRIGLQANIHEAERALTETTSAGEYCHELIAREDDLYQEFMTQLDADALALKQTVRVLIMRKLEKPEGVSAMSKAGAGLAQSYGMDNTPGKELSGFIEGQIAEGEEEKEIIMPFEDYVA